MVSIQPLCPPLSPLCRFRPSARSQFVPLRLPLETKNTQGLGIDGLDRLSPVDRTAAIGACRAVVGEDRLGLFVVQLLTEGDDLDCVILATFERRAVVVAGFGDSRRLRDDVVSGT